MVDSRKNNSMVRRLPEALKGQMLKKDRVMHFFFLLTSRPAFIAGSTLSVLVVSVKH